jgi:hypothetical protein
MWMIPSFISPQCGQITLCRVNLLLLPGPELTARLTQSPMIGLSHYTFTAATAEADRDYPLPFIPAATATLSGSSAAQLYANTPPIENAILVVAVEIFQSITAPGNQIMSDNFQPSPFILGRSLSNRVIGLLGPFLDVETMCQ